MNTWVPQGGLPLPAPGAAPAGAARPADGPPAAPDATAWQPPAWQVLPHGGPGADGPRRHDFSSNANAAGPLPSVARAVAAADRGRYPDPGYHALRRQLGDWHGVAAERVLVLASASAFIQAFTRAARDWRGVARVLVPLPGYANYAAEARRLGLAVAAWPAAAGGGSDDVAGGAAGMAAEAMPDAGSLCWATEPASPTGAAGGRALAAALAQALAAGALPVLDLAYQPLRLDGAGLPPVAAHCWQLWSPNKAAGLTGVRAAYAIAPAGQAGVVAALQAAAPSWPVGADGVALLSAFASDAAQAELAASRQRLCGWRAALQRRLRDAGWQLPVGPGVTPFFCARPPRPWDAARAAAAGVQLRDATGLGLPGAWRLSAQPPAALRALAALLDHPQEETCR